MRFTMVSGLRDRLPARIGMWALERDIGAVAHIVACRRICATSIYATTNCN